jgi:DNA-binding MarR family transcriptional regulator
VKQLHNSRARPIVRPADALERLFELAVSLGEERQRDLAHLGLTRARSEVTWRLHHEGPLTQRELSQALRCTPRNVTGLVDALQAGGYVTRSPHPSDRRATLVALTEQGTHTAAGWTREYHSLATGLLGDLSPAELASLVAGIDHVLGRLRERAEPAIAES